MLNTSAEYKTYIREGGHAQHITGYIQFAGEQGSISLDDSDFLGSNYLTIKGGSSRPNTFDLGIAAMRTMSCTLNNMVRDGYPNGKFYNKDFNGAVFYLKEGITTTGNDIEWVNSDNYIGRFTVDKPVKKGYALSITAVDDMYLFERAWSSNDVQASTVLEWTTHTYSISEILTYICDACNVTLTTPTNWINSAALVYFEPNKTNLTYRDVLGMICQITRTYAYINWDYTLCLDWYDSSYANTYYLNAVTYSGTTSNLFKLDVGYNPIVISAIEYRNGDVAERTGTTTGTIIVIENNLLISDNNKDYIMSNLSNALINFSYYTFNCEAYSDFSIEFGDAVTVVDKSGNAYNTILTNVTHSIRNSSKYSGDGETSLTSQSSSYNPISKIIALANEQASRKLTTYEEMAFEANTKFFASPAFYETTEYNADGSISAYYQHSAPTLEDSTYITKFTAGYIGYSNSKIDGVPQYTAIITGSGATIEHLAAKMIVADLIRAGSITSLDGSTFFNLSTAEIRETAVINGKTVVITMNPTDGFKITVDGVNVFYIGNDGTLYSASTITGSQIYTGTVSSVGDFLKIDLDNEELLFGDTNGEYHKIKYTEGYTSIVYTSYQSSATYDWEFKRASGAKVKLGIFGDISLQDAGDAIEWKLGTDAFMRAEVRTDAENLAFDSSPNGGVDYVF